MASTANKIIEFQDQVPPTEVNSCNVLPAWIATNEGGATPTKQ